MEFSPEPLRFVEKRGEESFIGRGTAEAKAWSDREVGEGESCLLPEPVREGLGFVPWTLL